MKLSLSTFVSTSILVLIPFLIMNAQKQDNTTNLNWKQLTKAVIIAAIFGGLITYALINFTSQEPDCCELTETCDLDAPEIVSATFEANTVNISWNPIVDADLKHYIVELYDLGTEELIDQELTQLGVTNTTFENISPDIDPSNLYVSVGSFCKNCTKSANANLRGLCSIIIEDIVMMSDNCLGGGCEAGRTLNTSSSTNTTSTSIPTIGQIEIYKAEINCAPTSGHQSAWFIVQVQEQTNGTIMVNIPEYADLNDHNGGSPCLNCSSYDAPEEIRCGVVSNRTNYNNPSPDYSLLIDNNSRTLTLNTTSTGCTASIEVRDCN